MDGKCITCSPELHKKLTKEEIEKMMEMHIIHGFSTWPEEWYCKKHFMEMYPERKDDSNR